MDAARRHVLARARRDLADPQLAVAEGVLAAVALALGAEALSIINNELVRSQSPGEHAAAPPVVRLAHLAVDVHGLADLVPVEGRLVRVDELLDAERAEADAALVDGPRRGLDVEAAVVLVDGDLVHEDRGLAAAARRARRRPGVGVDVERVYLGLGLDDGVELLERGLGGGHGGQDRGVEGGGVGRLGLVHGRCR